MMASAMMTSAQYGQLFFPASTDETPFSKQDSIIGPEGR
jgi:hypothetical protein